MEAWQRIGTYAAGLALQDAGVKGNADLLGRMDMIVAAAGGERDIAVDGSVLSNKSKAANPGAFLNEKLMNDLRPTLFLAQLSNLLAGNISIAHGVTGSSRLMGEEGAGVEAVRVASARIGAGKAISACRRPTTASARICCCSTIPADICGAAYSPVWERTDSPGMVLGLSARSWFWKSAPTLELAAQDRWHGLLRYSRAVAAAAVSGR
jgi:3-oxoacyl-[acyl-carrier-protein] synthase II